MDNLPIIISVGAFAFTIYQYLRNTHKADTTQITTVLIKLEAIADGIAEIKSEMKSLRDDIGELRERISKVEASSASAHKRIDRMEGKEESR